VVHVNQHFKDQLHLCHQGSEDGAKNGDLLESRDMAESLKVLLFISVNLTTAVS
jgi:hypothetical protein